MPDPTPINTGKVGNEIDSVAKKKYSFTLPLWAIVGVPLLANLVGVLFHV